MCQRISEFLTEYMNENGGHPGYWLATDNYSDAPVKDPKITGTGTTPPVPHNFKSAFIGKSLEDIVGWLNQKPPEVDLNSYLFAVLDKGALGADKTVVICKTGTDDLHDREPIACLRYDSQMSSLFLNGGPPEQWYTDEPAEIKYGEASPTSKRYDLRKRES